MIVAKFGGKSVSTVQNIETIYNIAKSEIEKNPVIVVSALSQVTNKLVMLAYADSSSFDDIFEQIKRIHFVLIHEFWGEKIPEDLEKFIGLCLEKISETAKKENKTDKDLDSLLMQGEVISSYIISKALSKLGLKTQQVLGGELIVTNDQFGSAEFIKDKTVRKTKSIIDPLVKKGIVPVVTGFIGVTENGEPTTLGRGGSDYTATILGYALDAEEIQIWTDVDGVFTADPRVIKNAKLLKRISFQEAAELSYFGAKVLHPKTMIPAIEAKIPMRVMNTMNPSGHGTIIQEASESVNTIKVITSKNKIPLINIYSTSMLFSRGFLAKVYTILAKHNISVSLVSSSVVSDSIILDNEDNLDQAIIELSEFATVENVRNFGIVSLVGEKIVSDPGIMKRIFSVLENESIPVKMVSLGATDLNISLVVESNKVEKAVESLHDKVILNI